MRIAEEKLKKAIVDVLQTLGAQDQEARLVADVLIESDRRGIATHGCAFVPLIAERHAHGVLPMVALAKDRGIETAHVPDADVREAGLVEGMRIIPVSSLAKLMSHLSGEEPIAEFERDGQPPATYRLWEGTDFGEIRGQEHVKRALEVAAAGGHNVLMTGPPGAGSTALSPGRTALTYVRCSRFPTRSTTSPSERDAGR